MAEVLVGKCNAIIDAPDDDGLVYVKSRSYHSVRMACLGTKEEAKMLMSDWLDTYDDDQPTI